MSRRLGVLNHCYRLLRPQFLTLRIADETARIHCRARRCRSLAACCAGAERAGSPYRSVRVGRRKILSRRLSFPYLRKGLRTWVGPMVATSESTFGGTPTTSIRYRRPLRSWLACNPTSSCQTRRRRPLPSSGRRGRSRSSLRAWASPSPAASWRNSTSRAGTSPASPSSKPRWEASGLSCSWRSAWAQASRDHVQSRYSPCIGFYVLI
jgi:hypothetical protein